MELRFLFAHYGHAPAASTPWSSWAGVWGIVSHKQASPSLPHQIRVRNNTYAGSTGMQMCLRGYKSYYLKCVILNRVTMISMYSEHKISQQVSLDSRKTQKVLLDTTI